MRPWIAALFCLTACGARSELGLPEAATGPLRVTSLSLGDDHSCALLSDGTADCWGSDLTGELGDVGTGPDRPAPIPLRGASGIAHIACGGGRTCAVLGDGTLECWGSDPESTGYVPPVVIGAGFLTASLATQGCGALDDGTVACWDGFSGALVPVTGLQDVVAVGVGDKLACALRAGGAVSCWGAGPLGDGTANGSPTPVDVVGLGGPVQQIAVGSQHACALLEDGSVACWGDPGYGNLGVAKLMDTSGWTPAPVVGLQAAKRISAYSFQTCAVLADGTVRHWGTDFNPGTGSLTPEVVPGLSSVVDVASGEFHNCALLADGHVECWGENYNGELGDGTKNTSEAPVKVIGLP